MDKTNIPVACLDCKHSEDCDGCEFVKELEYYMICQDARRRASHEEYYGDIAECDMCGKKISKDQAATWTVLTILCKHCNKKEEK